MVNQELACVVQRVRRSRSITLAASLSNDYAVVVVWGSTAAGVTTAMPGWCYELIVSFCDQVGSANVINANAVASKARLPAANPEWLLAAYRCD